MKKINKIVLKRIIDDDLNIEYLKTDYTYANRQLTIIKSMRYSQADCKKYTHKKVLSWIIQDHKRYNKFNNGELCQYGIKAEAEINTSIGGGNWLINHVSSGGLWGIDEDSGNSYFDEVQKEQLEDLKILLKELGFTQEQINKTPVEMED